MKQSMKSGAEKSAATCTHSSRLNKSQREQLHALVTKAWWPFDRADPKVLNLMHLSIVERRKPKTDLPEALL
jgi:hypothetical protein